MDRSSFDWQNLAAVFTGQSSLRFATGRILASGSGLSSCMGLFVRAADDVVDFKPHFFIGWW